MIYDSMIDSFKLCICNGLFFNAKEFKIQVIDSLLIGHDESTEEKGHRNTVMNGISPSLHHTNDLRMMPTIAPTIAVPSLSSKYQ
jgi:hypothetical protein